MNYTQFTTKLITSVLLIGLLLVPFSPVMAGKREELQKQYDELSARLAELKNQKKSAQDLANKYSKAAGSYQDKIDHITSKMALLDTEISELQAEIEQLEVSVKLLQEEISEGESIITQTEYDVEVLEKDVKQKVYNLYLDYKTGVGEAVIDNTLNSENLYRMQQYSGVITDQTLTSVKTLEQKIKELDDKRKQLEDKRVALVREQQLMSVQQTAIGQKKADLKIEQQGLYKLQSDVMANRDVAKGQANVLGAQQSQLEKEQDKIRAQIEAESGQIPVGGYVSAGTIIGYQGNTGHSYGSHLHLEVFINGVEKNPCGRLGKSTPFNFCRGDGTISTWPIKAGHAFTSSYGVRWGRMHHGIDLSGPHKTPIYATHSGYLKKWFSRGCWGMSPCNSGGTYIAEICQKSNCNSGIKTRYLHLDPSSLK